ncbi:MAG: NFACT family protein, partial [Clostridia bacterium]
KDIKIMAFDGIVTKAVVAELNTCLINGKINKIFEPNKNEILLSIYSSGKNYCLNISIDSTMYRINLTTNTKPNPQNVLNFCMVLRKHLIGGIIKRIYTNGLERIVFIDIETHNELNDLVTKTLVVELMGKHSNVILLNSNYNVIDSLRHLNRFDNSTRDIFPGSKYTNVVSDKLNFYDIKTFDEFYKSLNITDSNFSIASALAKNYNGFGKNNILYLLEYLNIADNSISTSDLNVLYTYLKNMISLLSYSVENLRDISNQAVSIKEHSINKKDYFICTIPKKDYEPLSVNFFIDDFYYAKETTEQFKTYKDTVLKLVLNQVKKIKEKISLIDDKIKECSKIELYKLYGELITSNLYRIPDYPQNSVTLENYYDNNKPVTIPLDSTISPSKNAKLFFKKYRKLQNTIAIVEKQKELAEIEIQYLDSIIYEINAATSIDDIDNIYSEICDNLLYKGKNINTVNNHLGNITNTSKKQNKENLNNMPTKYLIDGYTVLVGKNNKQNDYLTCKLAQNSDIWFHTKDIHGSHVVLKIDNPKADIPDSLLYKCASLAAYFSKARMSQNVPVDYTFIKYVKKPNGAKPGMVIYTNNKTLYVNPHI